jgi:hypothetical protein
MTENVPMIANMLPPARKGIFLAWYFIYFANVEVLSHLPEGEAPTVG